MDSTSDKVIYQHDVIEFVQVAVQFCAQLEQSASAERKPLVDTLLKLIPLLYMKANMLPEVESSGTFLPDDKVTEQDYEYVLNSLASVLGNEDEYLDVVYDEMMQTDDTRWKRISENLADAYQPIRNFLAVYQDGVEDCMYDALWALEDNFELYWGEALVDALRRLHRIKFMIKETDDEDSER